MTNRNAPAIAPSSHLLGRRRFAAALLGLAAAALTLGACSADGTTVRRVTRPRKRARGNRSGVGGRSGPS